MHEWLYCISVKVIVYDMYNVYMVAVLFTETLSNTITTSQSHLLSRSRKNDISVVCMHARMLNVVIVALYVLGTVVVIWSGHLKFNSAAIYVYQ